MAKAVRFENDAISFYYNPTQNTGVIHLYGVHRGFNENQVEFLRAFILGKKCQKMLFRALAARKFPYSIEEATQTLLDNVLYNSLAGKAKMTQEWREREAARERERTLRLPRYSDGVTVMTSADGWGLTYHETIGTVPYRMTVGWVLGPGDGIEWGKQYGGNGRRDLIAENSVVLGSELKPGDKTTLMLERFLRELTTREWNATSEGAERWLSENLPQILVGVQLALEWKPKTITFTME